MTFIVECALCQQAWEVAEAMYSSPAAWVLLPDHDILQRNTSVPLPAPCLGNQMPGLGFGKRNDWESMWPIRQPGRTRPTVFPGNGVRLVQPIDRQ